jgi:hypothetical protein
MVNMMSLALLATMAASGLGDKIERLGVPAKREAAVNELVGMGAPVVLDLVRSAPRELLPTQEAILDVIVKIGPPALQTLWRCHVPTFRESFSECDFAIRAVVRMSDDILPVFEAWVPERNSNRSDFAMRSLRALGPKRALPVLERLAKHTDQSVCRDAFGIIASWSDPAIGDALVVGLDSTDPIVRSQAFTGMRRIRDVRLIPAALRQVALDGNPGLQEDAAASLGVLYEQRFLQPILRVARHAPDVGARRTGSNTLLRVGDPLANALGKRYQVISVDPAAENGIAIRYFVQLSGTLIIALLILRLGYLVGGGAAPSTLALAVGGFYWGNIITRINGSVERELLVLVIPVVWLVARIVGTRMSTLKDLLIPVLGAFVGNVVVLGLFLVLGRLSLSTSLTFATYGWILTYASMLLGAFIALKRFMSRGKPEPRREHEVPFTRLATMGCMAFYAGYVFGWWKLWGYSLDAFQNLL